MNTHQWMLGMAAGILLGPGNGIALAGEPIDSTVGKLPEYVLASAAGSPVLWSGWHGSGGSLLGKLPSIVLSDGPPPQSRPALVYGSEAFYIFAGDEDKFNHFQEVGLMGDREDLRLVHRRTADSVGDRTCIQITYAPRPGNLNGWAGVYWLKPGTNWGNRSGGYNLAGMKRLTFWARGASGGETIDVFKVGGIGGPHPDTGMASIGPVRLASHWRQYVIDLSDVDLSKVSGGFAWSTSSSSNGGGVVFYLDEIRFER